MYSGGRAFEKCVQGCSGAPCFLRRAGEAGEEGMLAAWSLPSTPTLLLWRQAPLPHHGAGHCSLQAGPGHGRLPPCHWMGCVPNAILVAVACALWATSYPKKIFWVHLMGRVGSHASVLLSQEAAR